MFIKRHTIRIQLNYDPLPLQGYRDSHDIRKELTAFMKEHMETRDPSQLLVTAMTILDEALVANEQLILLLEMMEREHTENAARARDRLNELEMRRRRDPETSEFPDIFGMPVRIDPSITNGQWRIERRKIDNDNS